MYSFNRSKTVVHSTAKKSIQDLPIAKMSQDFDLAYSAAIAKGSTKSEAKAEANKVVAAFAATWGIKKHMWFWPQVLAHISNWKVSTVEGQYDPKSLLVNNCKTDNFNKGIYRICMYTKRGDFVDKQSSGDGLFYCALVPLILSAFKKYKDVPYSSWRTDGLELIVEEKLYEAMHQVLEDSVTVDDILEARDKGLEVKSGDKVGQLRSPKTTYMLYGVGNTCIGKLNYLAQAMICQTWCAHPMNRNKYMILDARDWDSMPEAYINDNPVPLPFDSSTNEPVEMVSDIDW